jgi:hypothetical protein
MNISYTQRPFSLHTEHSKNSKFVGSLIGLMLFIFVGSANAQTLVAVDDSFGIPSNVSSVEPLIVEGPGVLKNDTLDLGNIEDYVVTAELVSSVSNGTLVCPVDGALELCADGSFQYWPGPGFGGSDSFTYQAIYEITVSAPATVTLTACTEDAPLLFSCWKESAYRSKLAELGYRTFEEGFEGHAWDGVRSPNKAPAITSQGVTWTTNHPATNDITTGSGAARTGLWGGYDSNHGFATGAINDCKGETPPENCFPHDGLSGSIQPGGDPEHGSLQGAGGYFSSNTGNGAIAIILYGGTHSTDVGTLINVGKLPQGAYTFFGVIDATALGFTGFEFRELDGKVEQQVFVFGDDFTIATSADAAPNIIFGDGFESL